jgi:plastocyanin
MWQSCGRRVVRPGVTGTESRKPRAVAQLLAALTVAVAAGNLTSARGATTNVAVSGFSFSPKVVSIHVGDTVNWTGLGGAHSVTGDTPPETLCGGSFPPNCNRTFNISVVTPAAISNYSPRVAGTHFVFDHTANPGLRYVVESSPTPTNWSPLTTNTAASNSVEVMDVFQAGSLRFYRVGRLPNP